MERWRKLDKNSDYPKIKDAKDGIYSMAVYFDDEEERWYGYAKWLTDSQRGEDTRLIGVRLGKGVVIGTAHYSTEGKVETSVKELVTEHAIIRKQGHLCPIKPKTLNNVIPFKRGESQWQRDT